MIGPVIGAVIAPVIARPTWGICAQVKASLRAVETFVAWHLAQGADAMWIYFDDPDDPVASALAGLSPKIRMLRCGPAYWAKQKAGRPEKKTVRQTANSLHAYRRMKVDWMAHIDVDEFILPLRRDGDNQTLPLTVTQVLQDALPDVAPDQVALRLRPYEALREPDGAAPRSFRGSPQLPLGRDRVLRHLYGAYAPVLTEGMLSHAVGKAFSRVGVEGLRPRLHLPRVDDQRVEAGGFMRGLALLHYHATDPEDWLHHVAYRTAHGAYSGREDSKAFFEGADRAALLDFYNAVQVATPDLVARLADEGLLLTGRPPIEETRARMFGE